MDADKKLVTKHVRFTKKDIEEIEKLIEEGEYATFSEFIREAVRRLLREHRRGK